MRSQAWSFIVRDDCQVLLLIRISDCLVVKQGHHHVQARNETGARFLEYVQGIRYTMSFGIAELRPVKLEIQFENVGFAHRDGWNVLKNLSFTVAEEVLHAAEKAWVIGFRLRNARRTECARR